MLNLSDKELDRLAREAANEYEPGSQSDPGSWDRMQRRLDKELGYPRASPFRSIRRMSFYYAPAILLLAGITYFLLKPSRSHSGSHPPGSPATVKAEPSGSPPIKAAIPNRPIPSTNSITSTTDQSNKNPNNTYRSTSTPGSAPSATDAKTQQAASSQNANHIVNPGANADANPEVISDVHPEATPDATNLSTHIAAKDLQNTAIRNRGRGHGHQGKPGTQNPRPNLSPDQTSASSNGPVSLSVGTTGLVSSSTGTTGSVSSSTGTTGLVSSSAKTTGPVSSSTGTTSSSTGADPALSGRIPSAASPSLSVVSGIRSSHQPGPIVDDAGLRALGAAKPVQATPVDPGKKRSPSLHIDRRLQIGISLAPDFASVNSLAGDRPGSSLGITADYQFFSKWHLHTGFLLSHKNYTAAQQDYHVPYDYYRMNNMHDVYYVKGTLNLFEIPLNLRYDFSVAGNTLFFVSGGVSSYLLTHENCNYYFDLFGRPVFQEFKYDTHRNSLVGTVDLSMGVETGLTNSLSLLIAPYMKLPASGLGFGRVEMNSMGIEFGLKYAPVLRRSRRH